MEGILSSPLFSVGWRVVVGWEGCVRVGKGCVSVWVEGGWWCGEVDTNDCCITFSMLGKIFSIFS